VGKLAKKYKGKNTTTAGKKHSKNAGKKGKYYLERVRKLLSKPGESVCNCFVPGNSTKEKEIKERCQSSRKQRKKKTKLIFGIFTNIWPTPAQKIGLNCSFS
jgi:hypothetical protein